MEIRYHPAVLSEDLVPLPRNLRRRIVNAIEQRLGTNPTGYGIRLRRSLAGCWKLRAGDYRIVYSAAPEVATILAVKHRSNVYDVAERRLKRS